MATDADAQAYIDEVELQTGEAYPAKYDSAVDDLVQALKAAGAWSKTDVIYIIANHSRTAAEINLKDPSSFQLTYPSSQVPFTQDVGFVGDNTNAANTNWDPSTNGDNYVLNSASFGYWSPTANDNDNDDIETGVNAGGFQTYKFREGDYRLNSDSASSATIPASYTGLTQATRTDSTTIEIYINGTLEDTLTNSSAGIPTGSVYIMSRNSGGISLPTDKTISICYWGGDLSAEASDTYTAFDDYLTAIQSSVTSFTGDVSIGHTLGLSPSASAAVTGGVTNAQTMGMSDQGGATTLASLEQAISLALQTSGAISFDGNITINVTYGQSSLATAQTSASLSGAENVTLFHSYAMSTSAQSSAAGATTIEVSYDQSATGAVGINNFDASVALGDITYQTSITGTAQTVASAAQSIQYALDSIAAATVSSNTSIAYINNISASATVITVDVTLADGRTLTIKMQNRTLSIDSENRTLTIDP